MRNTNSFLNRLSNVIENSENILIYDNALIVTEKDYTANYSLDIISDVKVITRRALFINYVLVLSIFGLFYLFEKLNLISNNYLNVLLLVKYTLVIISLFVKKIETKIIVVTNNLIVRKFTVKYNKQNSIFESNFLHSSTAILFKKLTTTTN